MKDAKAKLCKQSRKGIFVRAKGKYVTNMTNIANITIF